MLGLWASEPDGDIITLGEILLTSLTATAAGWQISITIDRWRDQKDTNKISVGAA